MFPHVSSSSRKSPRTAGFTLIEMMVVAGLIVVLVAIIVPSIYHFKKKAKSAAVAMQLSGLQSALENYYADFNMYPPSNNPASPGSNAVYNAAGTSPQTITARHGANFLAEGLTGYLPASGDGGGSVGASTVAIAADPPYGFRTKGSGITASGKLYNYLPDNGSLVDNNPTVAPYTDMSFFDTMGNEILYFRSTRTANDVTGLTPVKHIFGTYVNAATPTDYYFEATDNFYKSDCVTQYDNGYVDSSNHAEMIPALDQTPPTHSVSDFKAFFQLLGASSSAPNGNDISTSGGPILGAGSYLLIGIGPDNKPYSGDDIIVVGK